MSSDEIYCPLEVFIFLLQDQRELKRPCALV